jgi:peptide deformylase
LLHFTLRAKEVYNQPVTIKLVDSLGKQVELHTMSARAEYYQFFTDHLTNGVYHLQIEAPGKRQVVRKVVVIKE